MMIDIHSHLLHGVDDGPEDVTAFLELASQALASQMTHVIVTPHHMHGDYVNPKSHVLQKIIHVQQVLQQHAIPLTILPGQEITLTAQFLDELEADQLLTLNHSRYMLIELPFDHIPKQTEDVFYELMIRDIIPIVAHPERNQAIRANPERLGRLISYGALSQLTASSFTQQHNPKLQKLALHLCKQGWVHAIASDAHDALRRPYGLLLAYQVIEEAFGNAIKQYFIDNTERIVNNELIPDMPVIPQFSRIKLMRMFRWMKLNKQ